MTLERTPQVPPVCVSSLYIQHCMEEEKDFYHFLCRAPFPGHTHDKERGLCVPDVTAVASDAGVGA